MNIITLDFETFYSDDYTLKKMTTEAYIRDPRFEVLGVGVSGMYDEIKVTPTWATGADIARLFKGIRWDAIAVLCHHAQFDGLILSHHFGIKPAFWLDTLSMARLVVGNHLSVALDSLAKHYGLEGKRIDYASFKDRRWQELDTNAQKGLADGCLHDVDLTWSLFQKLMVGFPDEELKVIDATVRMFTEPVLQGDVDLLAKVWMDEETRKCDSLGELGVSREALQSADAFALLLRESGVEPGVKTSPSDNSKSIYAFAKTDDFMKELIEDDGRAGALARARLGVKSTITQTRSERLGFMAQRGALPVYLRYSGAHTTRWAGGDSLNWQNFPRNSSIRKAIKAPEGGALIVLDLAQIECRMLNLLAGQMDVVEKFRRGEDPYIGIASAAYEREITKADVLERGTGKQLELSCGYQSGAETIQKTAARGTYGPPVIIDMETAVRWRDLYRSTHPHVVDYWKQASRMIARLAGGPPVEWGPMLVKDGRLYAPNGMWIDYSTLEYDQEWQSWKFRTRQGWTKLYGGKLTQNVMELLCRLVLSQAMIRITDKLKVKIATCTHDEIVIALSAGEARYADQILLAASTEMECPPAWLPELPLKVEGGVSLRYEK